MAFYIISIVIGFKIIRQIGEMYNDFRILVSQYNEIILYWKNIKTLFILPNITTDISNEEKKFFSINTDVLNVLSSRIANYKKIKVLYK